MLYEVITDELFVQSRDLKPLGRYFPALEAMSGSLRETVGRVSEAADRVEATAAEMVEVSTSVAGVTADQVRGIRQARGSMESYNFV